MQKLVFRNANGVELNLTTDPFGITEWEGFSADDLNIQSQQVPFQDGAVFLDGLLGERELSVTVAMQDNNNLETRYRLRREMIKALNPKLGEGVLIYTNDFLSKQIHCIPQLPVFENHNSNDSGTPKASCTFTACNPYWEDLEDTEIEIAVDEIAEIENEGDVPAQLKVDFFPIGSVGSPNIENIETGKILKLSGSFTDTLNISTEVGNKKVVSLDNSNLTFQNLDFWFKGYFAIYVESLDMHFLAGVFSFTNYLTILRSSNCQDFEIVYMSQTAGEIMDGLFTSLSNKIIFVIGNKTITSSDGKVWTESTVSGTFDCIAQNNSKIIMLGENGVVATSTNGNTFSYGTVPALTSYNIKQAIWAEDFNKFFAVGENCLLSSSDGTSWTAINTSYNFKAITYSHENTTLIAFGTLSGTNRIFKSTNGTDWTDSLTSANIKVLKWIPQRQMYVALGDAIYTSTNGTSYEAEQVSIVGQLYYFIYSQKISSFLILGELNTYLSSQLKYAIETITYTQNYLTKICYSRITEEFVALTSTNKIAISKNGTDWVESEETVMANVNRLKWIEEKNIFVLLGNGGAIKTSEDRVVWTERTSGINVNLYDVEYDSFIESYWIVGAGGTVLKTKDFVVFETVTVSGLSADLKGVAVLNYTIGGYVCIVGAGGKIARGSEYFENERLYTSWQITTITGSPNFNSVVYSKITREWVVVGDSGKIYSCFYQSIFQEAWVQRTSGTSLKINDVVYNDDTRLYYALCGNNEILNGAIVVSEDGRTWEELPGFSYTTNLGIAFSKEGKIVVAQYYLLSVSDLPIEVNEISKVTNDSDIGFNLQVGENKLKLGCTTGNFNARITYRQKYIGV